MPFTRRIGIPSAHMPYRKKWKMWRSHSRLFPRARSHPMCVSMSNCHMVFDIKMEDFQRKACLVAGGHMTHTLDTITYSCVVTRETVCISLTMATLHESSRCIECLCNGTQSWKDMDKIRSNFWDNAGKSAVIIRASYGLNIAGASFRAHLAHYMWKLGYKSCNAWLNLWIKAHFRPRMLHS